MNELTGKALTNEALQVFQGGGEMGALMRAYDWDNHPLGSPAGWPDSLKTSIRLILNSGFPMFLWWSEDLYMFHNDAYLPALGNKHPKALGSTAAEMWSEIWESIGVIADNIMRGGNPFYADSLYLPLERKGYPEETYWTFSYSPAFKDNGEIGGIFCACTEVTQTVLSERRLKCLKNVSEKMTLIQTLEQACQLTCDILTENKDDLPFSMIYLLNNTATEATLVGTSFRLSSENAFRKVNLQSTDNNVFAGLVRSKQPEVVLSKDLFSKTESELFTENVVEHAAVLPVMRPGQDQLIGFFIAGISPKLEYNTEYESFHKLLAGQIATSITSVQAREELARQQEYLREIFQQAPVGITILRGPEHIIDLANPGVCEIWGRKPQEVLGKQVVEALPEVVEQGFIQLLDNVYNTGVPFVADELPIELKRNGIMETIYLNFLYHPMRDAKGIVSGIIAVAIDISEQVKTRKAIEAMNKELVTTNSDLDNFVYSASHDLKAPISNIEGLMHALVDELPAETLQSDTISNIVNLIEASIGRFRRTVTDLSEVAKIQREAGDDVMHVNLAEIVNEVKLDFEPVIKATGAVVENKVETDAIIRFSAKNVRSVVSNLLSNSLKYQSADRQAHIQIYTEETPEFLVLAVKDNGLGIDLTEEKKMFSMFKRLHDHVEGSGIGLYIVKRILENAGGKIEVESEIGVGSTFKIYFKR